MKRVPTSLAVVVVSILGWAGCGGSTAEFSADDGGAAHPGATGGHGGNSGDLMGTGGGGLANVGGASGTNAGGAGDSTDASASGATPFDPSGLAGLLGAADGGLPSGIDAGERRVGDGGRLAPIASEIVDGCDVLCAKEATAGCPNQGTAESCVFGCRLLLNNPTCSGQSAALFKCAKTSAVSCDGQGKATLSECPTEQLLAVACAIQAANNPSEKEVCATYCHLVGEAKCPNDDVAGCQAGCQLVGDLVQGCGSYWSSYLSCSIGKTFSCGADGKAGAPACVLPIASYALCTLGGVLSAGDAGR